MSTADSLHANQDEIENEMIRHNREIDRLVAEYGTLIDEVTQELADEKQASHNEGYDEGVEAEKEPNR